MKIIKKFSAYFFFLLLGIAISTGVQVVYAHGGNTNFIHSCVKSNGAISIVSAGTNCASNETATDWTKVPWNSDFPLMCQNCDLTAATVGSLFAGKDLSNALVQNSNMSGTNFGSMISFAGIYIKGTNLSSTDWQGTTLVNFNFSDSELSQANFHNVNMAGANLVGADLNSTNFSGATLTNANLSGTTMTGANLVTTNVSGSNMANNRADLANFTNANLTNVNFTSSDLSGANFTGTTRSGIIWSNTTCPDGSNSDSNGNTCEGHL